MRPQDDAEHSAAHLSICDGVANEPQRGSYTLRRTPPAASTPRALEPLNRLR